MEIEHSTSFSGPDPPGIYNESDSMPKTFSPVGAPSISKQLTKTTQFVNHTVYWCHWLLNLCTRFKVKLPITKASRLIDAKAGRYGDLRRCFISLDNELVILPSRNSHSHPRAAAYRTGMNNYMIDVCKVAGYDPFMVSMSEQDVRNGIRGTRNYHGLKDLTIRHRDDSIRPNDCIIMCDVDYYVNPNDYLCYGNPILLYTLAPTIVGQTASKESGEYSFFFRDNRLVYSVAGKATYTHELWDYTGDTVTGFKADGSLIVYSIEFRNIPGDPNHRLIIILPRTVVPAPYYRELRALIKPISRLQVTQKRKDGSKVNFMYDVVGNQVSIARNGSVNAVTMGALTYESIRLSLIHI